MFVTTACAGSRPRRSWQTSPETVEEKESMWIYRCSCFCILVYPDSRLELLDSLRQNLPTKLGTLGSMGVLVCSGKSHTYAAYAMMPLAKLGAAERRWLPLIAHHKGVCR